MHRTLLGLLVLSAALISASCAGAPSPKPTPENGFLGLSVEQRIQGYTVPNVPPIIEAVWAHDAEAVAALVAKGAKVNEGKDDTPLVEALDVEPKDFSMEVLRALLEQKGIEVNRYSTRPMGAFSWCRTPLIAATYRGNIAAVKLLLDKGAKIDLGDWYVPDQTLFGKEPLNNPLYYAAKNGFPELVTLLLDRGAKIDYQNAHGATPLMIACNGGKEKEEKKAEIAKAVSILLERGAKYDTLSMPPNPKYQKVDLPPGTPAGVNAMTLLNGDGLAAMHYAANGGFLEAATLLLDKGAKIEIGAYANKWTPLVMAAQAKQNGMISFLLDRGANIEAADPVGTNALILTAMGLYYDTAALLLKRGANVNHVAPLNVLEYATNVGRADKEDESIKMMTLFLDSGVDVNFQGGDGSTALMMASGWGVVPKSPARAKLLLDRGAKPDLANKKGDTALILAAYRGYVDISKLLLDKGANVNAKNSEGRTALMNASAAVVDLKDNNGDFADLVKLLLDKGADVNVMDNKKSNALSLATMYGRKQTIALLTAKGATLAGTADPFAEAYKTLVGTWEGIKNSNPYETYRFVFKSDKTWTYDARASAAFKKEYPDQYEVMSQQYSSQAALEGSKGSYSFREQFLVLKTNSMFSPERVYQWKFDNGKLNLNGGEFLLTKVAK